MTEHATEAIQDKVIELLLETMKKYGEVKEKRFGDVVSLDLYENSKVVFNFQIAKRSAQLKPLRESPWKPVKLDSLEDLVASKMSALVARGIPRDFVDISEICSQKLSTIQQCWQLWEEREKRRGIAEPDSQTAKNAVRLHLTRIENMRPLQSIKDSSDKNHAGNLREWFKNEFLK